MTHAPVRTLTDWLQQRRISVFDEAELSAWVERAHGSFLKRSGVRNSTSRATGRYPRLSREIPTQPGCAPNSLCLVARKDGIDFTADNVPLDVIENKEFPYLEFTGGIRLFIEGMNANVFNLFVPSVEEAMGRHDAIRRFLEIANYFGWTRRMRVRGTTISNLSLAGADLREAWFGGARIENSDLSGSLLRGAAFVDATINNCSMFLADLSGVEFAGTRLSEVTLRSSDLRGARFAGEGENRSRSALRTVDIRDTWWTGGEDLLSLGSFSLKDIWWTTAGLWRSPRNFSAGAGSRAATASQFAAGLSRICPPVRSDDSDWTLTSMFDLLERCIGWEVRELSAVPSRRLLLVLPGGELGLLELCSKEHVVADVVPVLNQSSVRTDQAIDLMRVLLRQRWG